MRLVTFIIYWTVIQCTKCAAQRTNLDNFIFPYRFISNILNKIMDQDIRSNAYARDLKTMQKTQEVVDSSTPFPCTIDGFKSKEKPKSVDMLRPGDINVIGAMGDSLTAGIGALSTSLINNLREYRGVSFTIGGEKTWREYLTIPNILKVFNPHLVGYALRTSTILERASQFNLGENMAMTSDIYYMAKVLIKRITSDRRVDVKNDWKMISIFIGSNDFCNSCFEENAEVLLTKHKNSLIKTLRLLRTELPRTFVNLISPPDVYKLGTEFTKTDACEITHRIGCSCIVGDTFTRDRSKIVDIIKRWQMLEEEIANYEEFNQDNFTVVWQPLFTNTEIPTRSDGKTDLRYFAADCFHFSQRGHALVTKALWNNIMSPVGHKSANIFADKIICPTVKNPYLYTKRNSNVKI